MTFGERLKQLRESEGLKQIELAEKLNLTSAALSQYEKGVREPNSEMLKKIADYFDVSIDFLLGRIDVKTFDEFPEDVKRIAEMLLNADESKVKILQKMLEEFLEK
ncbi:hypothetical protein KD33_07195 [Clostridium sp. NCR]|nr:hypothetical protein KD33_07195 [Clostridium sp. NCR]